MVFKKNKRLIVFMILFIILILLTFGCSSNNKENEINKETDKVSEKEEIKDNETIEKKDKISLISKIDKWDEIEDISFSNSGGKIVIGSNSGVEIYSLQKDKIVVSNLGEKAPESKNLEFSPDDSLILSGWLGVDIYNAKDLKKIKNLHGGRQSHISFSPDGSIIATGNMNGIVWLWDTDNREKIKSFDPGIDKWVTALDFTSDGKYIAAAFQDGIIRVWDIDSSELVQKFKYDIKGGINDITFSPDDKVLAAIIPDLKRKVYIFSMETGNKKKILNAPESSVVSLDFSSDGNMFAYGEFNGKVSIWDTSDYSLIESIKLEEISSIDFSPKSNTLAIGTSDGTLYIYNNY